MMARLLLYSIFNLICLVSFGQVFQTNNTPYKFRALKGDTILILPKGCDTPYLVNPKWGTSSGGAIFADTCNNKLFLYNGTKWNEISGSGGGSDTSVVSLGFRAGSVLDTLYSVNSVGDTTDFYYVVVRDGLISGGIVTYTGFDLQYYVSAATYRKNGEFYNTNDTTITLPALASNDSSRIDLFVVNTSGQATTITGVEAANPIAPQINTDTDVYLTFIELSPTNPTAGVDTVIVYDENVEWTGSATGVTVNFDGATNVYRGAKTTDVGAINNNDVIFYVNNALVNRTDYEGISFFIRLKQTMPGSNNLFMNFYNGATQVSNEVLVPFNKLNTTSYMGVSLSFDNFTWTNNFFDRVRFRYNGGGAGISGMYLDFIYLQNGLVAPATPTDTANLSYRIDTLSNRVALKLNISDTASMLAPYALEVQIPDISGKLNISDTAAMLTPYLRKADTTAMLAPYVQGVIAGTNVTVDNTNPKYPVVSATGGGSGSVEYVVAGTSIRVDSLNRAYTVNADTGRANTQLITGASLNKVADSLAALGGGVPIDSVYLRFNSTASSVYSNNGGLGGTSANLFNVGIGRVTNGATTSGVGNIAIGDSALAIVNASRRVAIGYRAGSNANANSEGAVAIGYNAGKFINQNTIAIGNEAGIFSTASGSFFLGANAGRLAGNSTVAIGGSALQNYTGNSVVAIGSNAGLSATTQTNGVYLGFEAGRATTVDANTFVGTNAGREVTSGGNNTAIGSNTLRNTVGANNTAIGSAAMQSVGSGVTDNIAIGAVSLFRTTGSRNTGIGVGIGQGSGTWTGSDNSAIGYQAAFYLTSGTHNTIKGAYRPAYGMLTGSSNTMIGSEVTATQAAGSGTITGSNNIIIGRRATMPDVTASNQIVLGLGGTSPYNAFTRFTGGGFLFNMTTSQVNTQTTSAAVEINGTTGALLLPRLTTAERDALTATNGMLIYNTTTSKFQGYAGGAWVDLH